MNNNDTENVPKLNGYAWHVNTESKYEGKKVPEKLIRLIQNKESVETNQENLNKLIFRHSEIHCGSCVTREIRLLKDFAEEIGWDNIIFIASNSDSLFVERFKRVSQIKTDVYNVDPLYFKIDEESLETPYLFIVDEDSSFKELFISMRENEVRTSQYFKNIEKYFIE